MRLLKSIQESRQSMQGYVPRSVSIDRAEGIELIKKECSSALGAGSIRKFVYRGMNYKEDDVYFVQPSKGSRMSVNTINLYTVLIDNSSKWSRYPKRSKSVICSTDDDYASTFGHVFLVYPKDGYWFGVCPGLDLWTSFRNSGLGRLEQFNETFKFFMKDLDIDVDWDSFKTLADLKRVCSLVDKKYSMGHRIDFPSFMIRGDYKGDLYALLEKLFDPDRNDFSLSNNIRDLPADREVWTDSDCYMVSWKAARSEGIA